MQSKLIAPVVLLASCLLAAPAFSSSLLPFADDHAFDRSGAFPRRGYIISRNREDNDISASIGRRATPLSAERAAMRMLSRLIRWYPDAGSFGVEWATPEKGGKAERQSLWYYERFSESGHWTVSLSAPGAQYYGINRGIIRAVVRRSGIVRDVTRYGAADSMHPITLDLGVRASYHAGSRAAMRTLARRLKSPFSALVDITWKYRLPGKQGAVAQVRASYTPYPTDYQLFVSREIPSDSTDVSTGLAIDEKVCAAFHSVPRNAIRAVGERSGMFRDLLKYGAKGEVDERWVG